MLYDLLYVFTLGYFASISKSNIIYYIKIEINKIHL